MIGAVARLLDDRGDRRTARGDDVRRRPVGRPASEHICAGCRQVHGFGHCPTAARLTDEAVRRRAVAFLWW